MAFIKVQLTFQGLAVFFETIMIFVWVVLPVNLAHVMPSTLRFRACTSKWTWLKTRKCRITYSSSSEKWFEGKIDFLKYFSPQFWRYFTSQPSDLKCMIKIILSDFITTYVDLNRLVCNQQSKFKTVWKATTANLHWFESVSWKSNMKLQCQRKCLYFD
jgi:hypothetical protein